jgi:hypothetical protein
MPDHDPFADVDSAWYLDHVVLAEANRERPWDTYWRLLADDLRSDSALGRQAVRQGFVVTRGQVRAAGVGEAELRRQLRGGRWMTPWHATVALRPPRDDAVRLVLRASGAALTRPDTAVSHGSAARILGLPLLPARSGPIAALRAPRVQLVAGRGSKSEPGVRVRVAQLDRADLTHWYGTAVTTAARTAFDLSRIDRAQGLAAADAALYAQLCTYDELVTTARRGRGQGAQVARDALVLADGGGESALESITRLLLIDDGLPAPLLQQTVLDPIDGWRARVDMLWPDARLVLEADGRLKYTRDELWAEKRRQERLERLGYRVIRVLWDDAVRHPAETCNRVARALDLVR